MDAIPEDAVALGAPTGSSCDFRSPTAGPDAQQIVLDQRPSPFDTLMSGQRRELRGGAVQAHVCVVGCADDVKGVLGRFQEAERFAGVVSWSYAYRLRLPAMMSHDGAGFVPETVEEHGEDGLDEGCGERVLAVLRRNSLHGLLVVVSRWQDYGVSSGLELFGIELYSIVTERVKDIIAELRRFAGLSGADSVSSQPMARPPRPGPKTYDFGTLPPVPEPKAPTKYSPNHFMADNPALNRPASLPNIFSGGDPRQWMDNDRCLREFPESELWALRSLRQPDPRIERVLFAVAELRGQRLRCNSSSTSSSRWGLCREMVLRSSTLRTELLLLDSSGIPLAAAQRAATLLEGLDVADVRRSNPAVGALLEWAQGVVCWRLNGPPAQEAGLPAIVPLQPKQAVLPKLRHSKTLPGMRARTPGTPGAWPAPSPVRGGAGPPRKRPALVKVIA